MKSMPAAAPISMHTVYTTQSIKDYLTNYTLWLPEFIIYGGIGFLSGFLLRNFGRTIITVLGIVLVTLIVLQYMGMMTTTLPDILGLPGIYSIQEATDIAVLWIKQHVMGCVGFLFGFSIGLRLS